MKNSLQITEIWKGYFFYSKQLSCEFLTDQQFHLPKSDFLWVPIFFVALFAKYFFIKNDDIEIKILLIIKEFI